MKSLRACSVSLVVSVAVDCCKHQASLSGTIWRERIRVKFLREAASGSEVSRAPVRANLISQRARERTNAHRSRKKTQTYDMLARYRYVGLAAVVLALACADWCKYVPQAVWSEVSQCADC